MSGSALVIGGTGPTGPGVVSGLLDRGFDVTVLHGGHHEAELPPGVRHIHADPHWPDTLRRATERIRTDLVVAQYGRLAVTVEVFRGRTERLIAVGGAHGSLAAPHDPRWGPMGQPVQVSEEDEHLQVDASGGSMGLKMADAERALFDAHRAGGFDATLLAYPVVYGPRQVAPHDWCIVRRILDGRRRIVVADGGRRVESRLFTENAVAAMLAAVDRREAAAGRKFVVSDDHLFTMRQRILFVADRMGVDVELVDMPYALATPCHPLWRHGPDHRVRSNAWSRRQLGCSDVVAPAEALGATVDWLVDNPPTRGGPEEAKLGDPFDYPGEDELIEQWERLRASVSATVSPHEAVHAYRHPKRRGQGWAPPPGEKP